MPRLINSGQRHTHTINILLKKLHNKASSITMAYAVYLEQLGYTGLVVGFFLGFLVGAAAGFFVDGCVVGVAEVGFFFVKVGFIVGLYVVVGLVLGDKALPLCVAVTCHERFNLFLLLNNQKLQLLYFYNII